MSFRTRLSVIFALAVLAGAACEEFPEPLESDAGQIPIEIQPVSWPAELALGDNAVLEVEVVDGTGGAIQGVDVSWQLVDGSVGVLEANGTDALSRQLTGDALGWAHISMSVEQDPFVPTTQADSVPILLAGVALGSPAGDTTLTALGQRLTLTARGLDVNGGPQVNTGLSWSLVSGSAVTLVTGAQGDQIEVAAAAEGTTTIAVGHGACVSTGSCADTIAVTVDQVPDSVAVSPAADTMVAGDAVQLSAGVFDANGNEAPAEPVSWISRNPGVAGVDGTGRVTADSAGQTWVVATAGSASDSASITVEASGALSVDLTDAPADLLASADLFLSGVYVLDNVVSNGRRYLLDQPFSVDLLTLADTVTALATGQVPATTYNDLFLAVDSARITLLSSYTFSDATRTRTFTVDGDTLAVAINGAATLADGDTIEIVLDFDVDGSFPLPEPDADSIVGSASFTPTTRTVDRTAAASIAGTLSTTSTPSVADVTLRAVRTDLVGDTVYTRTDGAGGFKFRYLVPGTYDLTVPQPPLCHVANPAVVTQAVATAEAATGANFSFDLVTLDSIATTPAVDTINAIGFSTTLAAVAYEGTTPLTGLGVTWSSADPSIATVDRNGVVTGVAAGDARIVVEACTVTDTAVVTVRQVAAGATISPATAEVEAGDSVQFSAQLLDSAGVAIDVASFEFYSSDETIATVNLGPGTSTWATGVKSGSITVEALELGTGYTATADLSVLLAPTESFSVNRNNGCALTSTGQVACWGVNPHGVLGFAGTNWDDVYGPQTIPLPTSETFVQVSTGYAHACALTSLGEIYCWGSGGAGELGNGNNFESSTPVLVQQPSGEVFTDVAAGHWFTCAATESGQAYCWGEGSAGQLGNGSSADVNVPTAVDQSSLGINLFDVSAEFDTVCAVGTNGLAACWGAGHVGQLGNGGTSDSYSPVAVSMPAVGSFSQIVMGDVTVCALGTDAVPYCWGQNSGGLIDYAGGSGTVYATPQAVSSETFATLGMSDATLCGASDLGEVRCRGSNYFYAYGNGTQDEPGTFTAGATGVSATTLDGGNWATVCGLDASGDVYCWGDKGKGLTGTGDVSATLDAVVTGLTGAIDTDGSAYNQCALTSGNAIYCWGNYIGWFTGGSTTRTAQPTQAVALPAGLNFVAMDQANWHMCALTDAGEIYCIGEGWHGALGDGTGNDSPGAWVQASHPTGGTWTQVSAGGEHTCAVDDASALYCWGYNGEGELGTGTTENQLSPTQVADVGGVAWASVSAGQAYTCAVSTGSRLYCWGYNASGQLGTGDFVNYSTPTLANTSTFFDRVTAANNTTCGLSLAGDGYCWGASQSGQIGDGNNAYFPNSPVLVNGGFTYSQMAPAPWNTTCAIETDGTAKCWGGNWSGQYGNGNSDSFSEPVDAWTGMTLLDMAYNSGDTGCVIDSQGDVYCTGWHAFGSTGVGLFGYEPVPVRVGGSGGS